MGIAGSIEEACIESAVDVKLKSGGTISIPSLENFVVLKATASRDIDILDLTWVLAKHWAETDFDYVNELLDFMSEIIHEVDIKGRFEKAKRDALQLRASLVTKGSDT